MENTKWICSVARGGSSRLKLIVPIPMLILRNCSLFLFASPGSGCLLPLPFYLARAQIILHAPSPSSSSCLVAAKTISNHGEIKPLCCGNRRHLPLDADGVIILSQQIQPNPYSTTYFYQKSIAIIISTTSSTSIK